MRGIILYMLLYAAMFSQDSRAQAVATPVSYQTSGSVYAQNFDGLPAGGSFVLTGKGPFNISGSPINGTSMAGWQLLMTAGTGANASFAVGTGSSTGNGVYSFGSSGSADRALGTLASGSGIYAIGVLITNNTGGLLNRFTISFTAEQWRKGGSTNKNNWNFRYKTGNLMNMDQTDLLNNANLNFSSVINTSQASGLNGNLSENQLSISYSIDSVSWQPGEQLLLRWDDADETGNDDASGIDNFQFSATLASAKPSVVTGSVSNITANTALLNGTVNDNYATTSIAFEYDSLNTWINPHSIPAVPDTINAGAGNTSVSAGITGLSSGIIYYYRIKATNQQGSMTGATQNFTALINPATVITSGVLSVTTNTAGMGGRVIQTGGAPVTERGIVWSTNPNPLLPNNKIMMGTDTGSFTEIISGLPEGSTLYVRAYAINAGGIAYGDDETFITKTRVSSFSATSAIRTNSQTVHFRLQTVQQITGLSSTNFKIQTDRISNALITSVTGYGNTFTVTVYTGTDDGTLGIIMANSLGLSAPIDNLPVTATGSYTIDKTAPGINTIHIPDQAMKAGDTIPVSVSVLPDPDTYQMVAGTINDFPLYGWMKKNDSNYTALLVISAGGSDVVASANIPVSIQLADATGNNSSIYQIPIRQASDLIDANKPFILTSNIPANKLYKSGDTLYFILRFNEKIKLLTNGNPPFIPLTIGSKSRSALYASGSESDSLAFTYIIQPGDLDKNGIKIGHTIQLNNAKITDIAGNNAPLTFSNAQSAKNITVDAVQPKVSSVNVSAAASYKTGNLLELLVNYSEKVTVTIIDSLPTIQIMIGAKTRNVFYQSGSGGNALLFRYSIQQDDFDEDGIKVTDSLIPHNASIKDEAGNPALLKLTKIGPLSGIKINPVTAVISRVIVPAKGLYKTGDTLECIVNYTEKILVNTTKGIPAIKMAIGRSVKQALYRNGTGSNALVFSYIIQPGDEDTNGITLHSAISLNNGAIADILNNPAPILLNTIDNTDGILIDAVSPVINNLTVPVNRLYKSGDTLNFIFHFSEKITVHAQPAAPTVSLTIGTVTQYLHYTSGTGTDQLLFSYIVQKGDQDKNGIRLGSSVILNNSLIRDIAGNEALTNIKKSGVFAGIQVDGIAPCFLVSTDINIPVCENGPAIILDSVLTVRDEESGELISWIITSTGYHGSIPNKVYSFSSNGKTMLPNGFTYVPFSSHHGSDTILVKVSDGVNSIEKKLFITIQPGLPHGIIEPSQIICINQTPAPISGPVPIGNGSLFACQWETAGIDDSLNFRKAPGTNDAQAYSALPLNNHTWFRRIIRSGICSDTSSAIKITVIQNGLWLGKTNNHWNNSQNWCNHFVPDNTTDVRVHASSMYYPAIEDTASCHHLMIADKAYLNITGELKISGDIYPSSGSIRADKGSLVFTGNTKQTISGNSFNNHLLHNLVIENREGTAICDSLLLSGTLLLYNGSVTTNNQLHLQTNAVIGPSASGTSIKGNISLEHKIRGGRRCFWLLGHPFNTDTGLQLINKYIDITGDGGQLNGFTSTATNQPSAFRHDPITGNDTLGVDAGWIPFTHTNGRQENAWKKHSGIRLMMRGKPGQGLDGTPAGNGQYGTYLPEPVILKASGPVNTGDQEITVQKGKYAGYNVIANPYPSPINLSLITRAGNIGMHYWIWNPQQGKMGGYSSIPFTSKYILPAFGAIIVKANDQTDHTILITENCKTTDAWQENLPVIEMDDTHHLELRLETDSIFWDRILLFSIDSAKTGFDKNDAEKFLNNEVNFYSISRDKKLLSTDARPISNESVITLGLQTKEPGTFRIRVMKAYLASSNKLMLHDRLLNTWMHLENDSSYSFSTTNDTTSKSNDRFEIISQKKFAETLINTPAIRIKITPVPARNYIMVRYHSPETANTTVRLLTLSGSTVKNIPLGMQKEGQVSIPVGELIRGIYLIELTAGNQINTQKIIKD